MSWTPGTRVGRYVVQRKIAEGGMAEIFLAASHGPEGFEKDVVLKRVRSMLADDPSFIRMFIAEARVASRLNHANVVHIFDFDRHGDSYYLAMEYVRGKSLSEMQRRARLLKRVIPPLLSARIVHDVARGLGYAHRLTDHGRSLGIVHRDVTPQNVLLSFEGEVKLTDFGIAKASSHSSTVGTLKGKFAYMAPEQARGETVDARTDVFALGVILWELLAHRRLFEGETDISVLRAVQELPIPSPRSVNPAVDEALSAAVLRALQRAPERRFQSAQEMEHALLPLLAGARSVEETDVGTLLDRLFPGERNAEEPRVAAEQPAPAHPPGPPISTGMQSTVAFASPRVDPTAFAATESPAIARRPESREVLEATSSLITDQSDVRAFRRHPRLKLGAAVLGGLAAVGASILLITSRDPPGPPAIITRVELPVPKSAPALTTSAAVPPTAPTAPQPPAALPAPSPSPEAAAPPVSEVGPQPAQPASTTVERAPPPRHVQRAPGFLVVEVRPWGELSVDGKPFGEVEGSSRRIPLQPGEHAVKLQSPGKLKAWSVTIESGKTSVLRHQFGD